MPTLSHTTSGGGPVPNIDPYWSFARNPANQGKNVVKISNGKLGIAVPNSLNQSNLMYLDKEGLESTSDDHQTIVEHFQRALRYKYQKKYGDDFLSEIFSELDIQKPLLHGLSHRTVSQVYKKASLQEGKKLLEKMNNCHDEAQEAYNAALRTDDLFKVRDNALKVTLKHQEAREIMTRLDKIERSIPGDLELKRSFDEAKRTFGEIIIYSHDAKELCDRNRRLLNGPSLDSNDLKEKEALQNLPSHSREGLSSVRESVPLENNALRLNGADFDKKQELLKNQAQAGHDAVLSKLDALSKEVETQKERSKLEGKNFRLKF
jgi:hypothetical protein